MGVPCCRTPTTEDTAPQLVTLADGTKLKLRNVALSEHPRYCFGNLFQKLGARIPGKTGDYLSGGNAPKLGDYSEPVLAAWFSVEETNLPNRSLEISPLDEPVALAFRFHP